MSRPPLLLFLLLVTSRITSSQDAKTYLVDDYEAKLTVDDGCSDLKNSGKCEKPKMEEKDQKWHLSCPGNDRVIAPVDILIDKAGSDARGLNDNPVMKAACVSPCDRLFMNVAKAKCDPAVDSLCDKIKVDDNDKTLSCEDPTRTLVINGLPIKGTAKCVPAAGWKDTQKGAKGFVVNFDEDTDPVNYYCHENCGPATLEGDCNVIGCDRPKFVDDKVTVVKCLPTAGFPYSRLISNNVLYETAECSGAGWKLKKSPQDANPRNLINFQDSPFATLKAECLKICDDSMIVNSCVSDNCKNAEPKFNTGNTNLTCPPNYFLRIDDVDYKELQCSLAGLGDSSGKLLVDYTKDPRMKIRAKCLPYCDSTMVIDACTPGECTAKPEYKAGKLTCSPAEDHDLIVNSSPYTEMTCTAAGWKSTNPEQTLVDYTTSFDKIKAYCKRRVSPPEPTTPTTTESAADPQLKVDGEEGGVSSTMFIGGLAGSVVVSLAIGVGIGMLIFKNKKKKSAADGASSARITPKRKSKKASKKEKTPVESDVTVMMPGHQMSQLTSGNLTAAIAVGHSPASIPTP